MSADISFTTLPAALPALASHPFLDALAQRTVVLDGAMGTSLQEAGLTAADFGGDALEGCNEVLVRTRPDAIDRVHRAFLEVGCHAVETDTFGGAPWVLDEYGLGAETETLNRRAAEIARAACDAFSTPGDPRWVVGSIGPGTRSPTLSLGKERHEDPQAIRLDEMEEGYRRQIRALLEGGTDVLLIETSYDLLQVKAAVAAANDIFVEQSRRVPLMVQFTVEKDIDTMLLGSEPLAAIAALDPLAIDVLGINCATGPTDMREHVRTLSRASRMPISILPNAGLPELVDGRTVYRLSPDELAAAHVEFVDAFGVSIVGGCCGTTPAHLAAVVEAVGALRPRPRLLDRPSLARLGAAGAQTDPARSGELAASDARETITVEYRPALASLYTAVPFEQENTFLAIGERANANGSRAFKDLLLSGDLEGIVQLGRSQTREGAHVLDVCVDYVGREGAPDMVAVVDRYATSSTLPLVIDSTQTDVIEVALARLGGRGVINSVNLEDGRIKADRLLPLARRYGAAVIVLAIDEEGQARTADWKVRVCERVARIAIDEYGLEAQDLVFDCLTFPLGSGAEELRRDAIETLDAIEGVKRAIPGCYTTLGLSNVSFGLSPAARQVLNSVFLEEAIARGLDSAIVHPGRILPLHRIPDEQVEIARDLIHDRRGSAGRGGTAPADYDPLTAFMAVFDGVTSTKATADELSALSVEERLERRIVDGDPDGIDGDLDTALVTHLPLDIINKFLLSGMRTVGELFGAGRMQLPFVLQSAQTMKTAVAFLEPHIAASGGASASAKGTVLLATVKGDVHDIGKNLVDIILRNNGYDVVNLGIKQSIDQILTAADEHGADVIGMSGLLVKSTVIMRENLEEMNVRGVANLPVLLGGAALTRGYVEDDLRAIYEGKVFYCKDAFEALRVLEQVLATEAAPATAATGTADDVSSDATVATVAATDLGAHKPRRVRGAPRAPEAPPALDRRGRPRSDVASDVRIPVAPFYGQRVVRGVAIDELVPLINEVALFRNQWGFTPGDLGPDGYRELLEREARPVLRDLIARAKAERILTPSVVYGYYPANGDGDEVVVWDPAAPLERELVRFAFPRQDRGRFLCIADFLRSVDDGVPDVLGLQVVTMGSRISDIAAGLFAEDRYQDYLYTHGFGVEMAEALAELWHRRMRVELGIDGEDGATPQDWFRQGYRGSRYSFGYPACPRLEDQELLFQLIDPAPIGVNLTDEFMLHPEQSTSAIVLHHPEARYFNAREPSA